MTNIDDIHNYAGFDFLPYLITYQIPITYEAFKALQRNDRSVLVKRLRTSPVIRDARFYESVVGPVVEVQIKTCINFEDQLTAIGQVVGERIEELIGHKGNMT